MTKRIVLCADDYGQAEAISAGILALIQAQRLSATSCMVNMPDWPKHAVKLKPYQGQVDIGLHFNLTHGKALSSLYIDTYGKSFFPLSTLLRKAFLGQLNQAAIEAECSVQIQHFHHQLGFMPDFIDGHQHVHQFPIIRKALIQVYEQQLRKQPCYVRSVNEKIKLTDIFHDFKKIIIYFTGTKALKRLLTQYRIPHNASFAGIYHFDLANQYATLFPRFLEEVGDRGLIMCHPGLDQAHPEGDEIAVARRYEYDYFMSADFKIFCQKQDVSLIRGC